MSAVLCCATRVTTLAATLAPTHGSAPCVTTVDSRRFFRPEPGVRSARAFTGVTVSPSRSGAVAFPSRFFCRLSVSFGTYIWSSSSCESSTRSASPKGLPPGSPASHCSRGCVESRSSSATISPHCSAAGSLDALATVSCGLACAARVGTTVTMLRQQPGTLGRSGVLPSPPPRRRRRHDLAAATACGSWEPVPFFSVSAHQVLLRRRPADK